MTTTPTLSIDNINTPKKAGLALRRLRKLKKLSQADLAKIMNMRQPTISDIESGKGTLESFFKIIQALKVNLVLESDTVVTSQSQNKNKSKIKTMINMLSDYE